MNLIELENLSKTFGAFRALDGVSAKVSKGAVGLLGPNGAGKSTLIKCLLGLVKPSAGTGSVLGIDIGARPLKLRQAVGYLPEVDCHIPGMSAVEFVAYAGELVGMPPKDAMTRSHEVLDYVGLADERYRLVHTYSTGMRQRVKLAQALVHDPQLVFLDEPTNGLDPRGRELMLELVRDLTKNCGMSIVYSSHLLADVEQVCDTILIMRGGRLIAQGSVAELRGKAREGYELSLRGDEGAFVAELTQAGIESETRGPGKLYVSWRAPSDEAPEPKAAASLPGRVLEAASSAGIQLRALRPMRVTLEEAFVHALREDAEGKS